MSHVGGVAALAALIAQEVRARRRAASPDRQGGPPPSRRASAQLTLQQRIASRLGAIDADDPDRDGKGLKVFLEAVFLEEFGAALIDDPSFHELLANVHASMMGSEALARPIRAAMSDLLGD